MEKHVFNTSINVWLLGIDSSPLKNQEDLDSININCVKFLCQPDFVKKYFPSELHQRIILYAVSKHYTPDSKKGIECFQEIRRLAPQKLCYDEKEKEEI